MWWHGPSFLTSHENYWPKGNFTHSKDCMPEQRKVAAVVVKNDQCIITDLLRKYFDVDRICRIIAYCKTISRNHHSTSSTGIISATEMSSALEIICKIVQQQAFASEYDALKSGKTINSSSRLLSLSPFMSEDGLIRVGGRLKNSDLAFDAYHPILLPRNHELTQKLIKREHVRNMHAGVQATMASLKQHFWPISLQSATRKIIQGCVTCFKLKPCFSEAIMGSLPSSRVTPSRPFVHCGVDYVGPITVREGNRRNSRNNKAYIAIFVCFATKAMHIELVSNLTTEAFLGAFKRFIARRGKPSQMYSDNGTTFVGAQRQLKELYEFHRDQKTQRDLSQHLGSQGIAWNFIPPRDPLIRVWT